MNFFSPIIFYKSDCFNKLCGFDLSNIIESIFGFSGSAAFLIFEKNKKTIFVDPRYTLQAKQECKGGDIIECKSLSFKDNEIVQWFQKFYSSNKKAELFYDPRNFSISQVKYINEEFPFINFIESKPEELNKKLNILDSKVEKKLHIERYEEVYAGCSYQEKIKILTKVLDKEQKNFSSKHALLITSPEEIAWLLNVRAFRIFPEIEQNSSMYSHTVPAFPCFAILKEDKITLFCEEEEIFKVFSTQENHFIVLTKQNKFEEELIKEIKKQKIETVFLDEYKTSQAMLISLKNSNTKVSFCQSYISKLQCIKNKIEVENAREINKIESAVIIEFLYCIEDYIKKEPLSEYKATLILEDIRRKNKRYKGPSFKSIIACGANAAAIHYTPSLSSTLLESGEILLIDVGGQYLGGTTDMTRTIFLGNSEHYSQEKFDYLKSCYTSVLKGHIALADMIFPKGTTGAQLDAIARQFLWKMKKNYKHGTGHGVGNCLSVHEGGVSISPNSNIKIEKGLILSNEPGYYEEGNFGIRLENLMVVEDVVERELEDNLLLNEEEFLKFDTITLVPFEASLIDFEKLNSEEKIWLQWYHIQILNSLKKYLSEEIYNWVEKKVEKFLKNKEFHEKN